MDLLPEETLHQGVSVEVLFGEPRPRFGDLYLICGEPHPLFPPSGAFGFDRFDDLQFSQVGDYLGVKSVADDGAEVAVWLYPLVDGEPVHHHHGPYDGVRLSYNALRNPVRFSRHYLYCVQSLSTLGCRVRYSSRGSELGIPPDLSEVRTDIESIIEYWASRGVVAGSEDALLIDY